MDYPDSGIVNIGINKERDTQPFFLIFIGFIRIVENLESPGML